MKAVEEYIEKHTRNYCNEFSETKSDGLGGYISRKDFAPWLTPDHARSVAEIARKETIKEVCEWIETHLNDDYISVDEESVRMGWPCNYLETNLFIEDLKKHLMGKV